MQTVKDLFNEYFGLLGQHICPRWWGNNPATADIRDIIEYSIGLEMGKRGYLLLDDNFWDIVVEATIFFGYKGGRYVLLSQDLEDAERRLADLREGYDPYKDIFWWQDEV